jgi:hypothetical protein
MRAMSRHASAAILLTGLLLAVGCSEGERPFPTVDDDDVVDDDDAVDDDDSADCGPLGSGPDCAAASCAALLEVRPDAGTGLYWLDPDGDGGAFETRCDDDVDGGGWTLLLVSADDAVDTWTWNQRALWTSDASTVGSPGELGGDFKSPALHELPFRELLFRHHPSQTWVVYEVGDGGTSLAGWLAHLGGPLCWQAGEGHAPTAISPGLDLGGLCDDRLVLNPIDQDGDAGCDPGEPGSGANRMDLLAR